MTGALFALLERLHGHLGLLALAALLHPLITLRLRPRFSVATLWSAWIGALSLATTFAAGWWIYPDYRQGVKPGLREELPGAMLRFETKEHLAFIATCLALAGAVALWRGGGTAGGRRLAWWLLLCAWVCGALTAGLGIYVASAAHPGW